MRKNILLKGPAAALLVLALASCGGGGGGGGESVAANNTAQANDPGQAASNDSFLSRVIALVQSMSETSEPDNIDSITVTTPETSEPQPIS